MYINANGMAVIVADRMISIVDANRKSFIDDEDFESVFENCFDMIIAPKIPKWGYEAAYEAVCKTDEITLALTVIKEMINEDRKDFEAKEKDIAIGGYMYHQMRSRGLSQKDFI